MFNKIKIFLDKYLYLISILIYVALNLFLLQNKPISDDIGHIFHHRFVFEPSNPFVYFNPFSEYFKSWGFTYFYLWFATKLFGANYFLYRLINMGLHIGICSLLSSFTKKPKTKKIIFFFLIFHPLSILTTTWIFQFKTLSATLFFLLFLKSFSSNNDFSPRDIIKLLAYFFLSLTSKIIAILLPLYLLTRIKSHYKDKTYLLLTTLMFIISGVYGILNIKGITYIAKEVKNIQKDVSSPTPNPIIKPDEVVKTKDKNLNTITIYKEVKKGIPNYLEGVSSFESLKDKYIISLQNLSRSLLSIVGINRYMPFYENNIKTLTSPLIYIHITIASFLILGCIYFRVKQSLLYLLVFIPISGLLYVPYMKYSYSSDHWNYPLLIPFILILLNGPYTVKLLRPLIVLCFVGFISTIIQYYNFNQLFIDNYRYNKNKIAIEEIDKLPSNHLFTNFSQAYDHILSTEDFYNEKYYIELAKNSSKEGDYNKIHKHFYRFAANIIQSEDTEKLNEFNDFHKNIINNKKLDALEVLISAETQSTNDELYNKLEKIFRK